MSALRWSDIGDWSEAPVATAAERDEASPYTVSILYKGLVMQTLVDDLSKAYDIIDRAEAVDRFRSAAIVDRNGRHVPRRSNPFYEVEITNDNANH